MLDKLTGLYQKKYFLEQLDLEVKRCARYRRPLSVLALELDYAYFHPDVDVRWSMGYTLFKQLGPIVISTLRNVDLASRFDGEVFLAFLPETGREGALIAGERLRSRVERHWFLGQVPGAPAAEGLKSDRFRVALNVGVAIFPENGLEPPTLVEASRGALMWAKSEGSNRVKIASSGGVETSLPETSASERPRTDAPTSWDALATDHNEE